MARKLSGSAYERDGRFYVAVTIEGRKRKTVCVPSAKTLDEAKARASVANTAVEELRAAGKLDRAVTAVDRIAAAPDRAEVGRVVRFVRALVSGKEYQEKLAPFTGVTFTDVRKELSTGRLHERYHDIVPAIRVEHAGDIKVKAEKYIEPIMGAIPVSEITIEHAEQVMARLPSHLSTSTRRTIAWVIRRVMEVSVYPLKLIKANPIPQRFMPRPGPVRARGMLMPDEEALLMGGADGQVPLVLRLFWGFCTREGPRKENVAALEWSDTRSAEATGWIDLKRGWVVFDNHKTSDYTGPIDWPLDGGVVEALKAWRKRQPKAARLVFSEDGQTPIVTDHMAEVLREALWTVGVRRRELHISTRTRRQINVHDLRGIFVTISLAAGKSEGWITKRTGHTSSQMLRKYQRHASNLAEGGKVALTPLSHAIPELSTAIVYGRQKDEAAVAYS